jgi:hypothetical protein
MVVCSCRDIRDSQYCSREELCARIMEDDVCCGKCQEEFLFVGGELGSIDGRVGEWTARECETR